MDKGLNVSAKMEKLNSDLMDISDNMQKLASEFRKCFVELSRALAPIYEQVKKMQRAGDN